jgi:hypothetical protein
MIAVSTPGPRSACAAAAIACLLSVCGPSLQGQESNPATLPRIAIEQAIPEGPELVDSSSLPFAHIVRLAGAVTDPALDRQVAALHSRKERVWLAVESPASVDEVEAWLSALQALLARRAEAIVIVEIAVAADPLVAAFAIRLAATEVRSARESIHVAISTPAEALVGMYTNELAPYVDLLVLPGMAGNEAASAHLQKVDADARLAIRAGDAGDEPEAIAQRLIDTHLEAVGTNIAIVAWTSTRLLRSALKRLAPIARLIEGDITELDSAATGLALSHDGRDVTKATPHRLLFDNRTFATYLVYRGDASPVPLDVTLTLPVEGTPVVYRLADGAKSAASTYSREPETGRVRAQIPLTGGPMLVDFNEGASAVYVERSAVSAALHLSVDEIIARHQQQQRTQDALVRSYIASARSEQHFRPTVADPGYDVVSDNRYYVSADGIEWEELSFSVNGSRWGPDRPPFPLLQPEKVLSLPLQLRFGADYRYRLAGTERVGEFDCYVVRFDPVVDAQSLYRGTVWIERRTFARVKVSAVQTNLSAPVVSNAEVLAYRPITSIGNRPVFLLSQLTARQIILIAGRNILVEKIVAFGDFRVNDPAFEEARAAARRSDRVMYRETDKGLRYYVKEGDTRVVSERATRTARAMAMGVTLDPSYAFPLPIFGINYLNFEFRGRPDTQLAVLFAGVLAAGNIQRPDIGGTPFDASIDFFAIAVPSSDRLFEASGERESERLLTWPLTTGANLGWQFTPFQKVSAQYQFRFDGFVRDRTTSEEFTVPTSTTTNAFGGGYEYRRRGYSFVVNSTWFARAAWRDWGFEPDPGSRATYVKYGASISRDFFFNVFHKVHLNGAWFGGRRLDRFAKYQFGIFDDTRIHGVPASGARFEELGMARGSYSFNIFEQYRLDLFLEQAWGRDRAVDPSWQPITGIGAAVNLRAPWGTMLRVDAGKSVLPARYKGIGSATLQILVLKPRR